MLKWRPGPPPVTLEGEVVFAVLSEDSLPKYSGKPVAIQWWRNHGVTTFGEQRVEREHVAFHHVLKGRSHG